MTLTMSESAEEAPSTLVPPIASSTREGPRFSFVAEADVIDLSNRRSLAASVSDLSAHGCYLDTPDALSVGTEVQILILHSGSTCELPGRVIYVHKGWGMGVVFGEASAEQREVLDGWLAELESKGK